MSAPGREPASGLARTFPTALQRISPKAVIPTATWRSVNFICCPAFIALSGSLQMFTDITIPFTKIHQYSPRIEEKLTARISRSEVGIDSQT
jgi:hypothetical protein